MTRGIIESYEIAGAQRLLEKLRDNFDFSISPVTEVPIGKGHHNGTLYVSRKAGYPLTATQKRKAGIAMVEFLLGSEENMVKWLYGDCDLCIDYEKNRAGAIRKMKIYIRE